MKLFDWLLELLYPPKCIFCGKLLSKNESDLCKECRHSLPEANNPIKRGEFFECCYSSYYYEEFVADSVKRYKFHGMQQYAEAYGRLLAMLLLREKLRFDVLTWVPTSDTRIKSRGYDQTRLLAEAVAREMNVECVRCLKKTFHNTAQSTIRDYSARKANVLGVFAEHDAVRFEGKRVLLIDDVITSGATLSECSRVLLTAGADSVVCATFAATREKEKKQ